MYVKTMTFYIFYTSSSHHTALFPCYYIYCSNAISNSLQNTTHFYAPDVPALVRLSYFLPTKSWRQKKLFLYLYTARSLHLLVSDFHPSGLIWPLDNLSLKTTVETCITCRAVTLPSDSCIRKFGHERKPWQRSAQFSSLGLCLPWVHGTPGGFSASPALKSTAPLFSRSLNLFMHNVTLTFDTSCTLQNWTTTQQVSLHTHP